MACFRLVTFFPLRPLRSVPAFRFRMADFTIFCDPLLYLAIAPPCHTCAIFTGFRLRVGRTVLFSTEPALFRLGDSLECPTARLCVLPAERLGIPAEAARLVLLTLHGMVRSETWVCP